MKKLFIVFIFLLALTGCEQTGNETVDTTDCDKGDSSQNLMCNEFKTVNLLGYSIVYDLSFYADDEESIDWMEVLYQYPLFYDQLIDFYDLDMISFDTSDFTNVEDTKSSVHVVYDDGVNGVLRKSFFVTVSDVGNMTNNDGNLGQIAIGSFNYIYENISITFDTHDNDTFALRCIWLPYDGDLFFKIYIYRDANIYLGRDVTLEVSPTFLGYQVDVVINDNTEDKEIVETFFVMHNDNILDSTTRIAPTNTDGILESLPARDGLSYELIDFYVDNASQRLMGEFRVTNGETVYLIDIDLEMSGSSLLVEQDFGGSYQLEFYRVSTNKLDIYLSDDTNKHYIIYSLIGINEGDR